MLTENREFNEIYEQYKNLILKAAYTYSGSYSAAEDIPISFIADSSCRE